MEVDQYGAMEFGFIGDYVSFYSFQPPLSSLSQDRTPIFLREFGVEASFFSKKTLHNQTTPGNLTRETEEGSYEKENAENANDVFGPRREPGGVVVAGQCAYLAGNRKRVLPPCRPRRRKSRIVLVLNNRLDAGMGLQRDKNSVAILFAVHRQFEMKRGVFAARTLLGEG